MRRHPLAAFLFAAVGLFLFTAPARAQYPGGGPGPQHGDSTQQSDDDNSEQQKKDEEWNGGPKVQLPGQHNAGPCPFVKILYDAGRYEEFADPDHPSIATVGYTGEIQNLTSGCAYGPSDPIRLRIELLFGFGRGPQAQSSSKDYRYWVAVTDRNMAVLAKEYFTIHANFPAGQDRVMMTDHIDGVTIPRASTNVSGSNFEVLVGFDVTPEMADFNRQGKRFHPNAVASEPQP